MSKWAEDIDFNPEEICLNCGHSMSTEEDKLICVYDKNNHKQVKDYDICDKFN